MPSDIRSTTGVLSLTFHTDLAVAKDGFSAQYYLIQQEVPESKLELCVYDLASHVTCFSQVFLSLGTGRSVSRDWCAPQQCRQQLHCVLCFSQQ